VAGLSGHLRDLLVAKDPKTVDLLEVSDNIKQQYLTQSKSLELPYLMKALDLSTETDINYKLSKSPHLLVELCLMKLASLPDSDQAKKKVVDILPASYFRHTTQIVEELKPVTEKSVVKEPPAEQIVVTNTETSAKKQTKTRKSGGLSLAGFKNKKNELIENERRLAGKVLPTDSFTEEEFFRYWKLYLDNLRKNQEKNLLSILSIDPSPKLEGAKIGLVLSNNSLKKELERNKEKVLKYLRTNLNNFDIDFKITVNEEKQKDFVYTRPQKFQKMLEKYPDLQYLKDKFDLDV